MNFLHIHRYEPILSQYRSFNCRKIVYECRCGDLKVREVCKDFSDPFPVPTNTYISKEQLKSMVYEMGRF